MAHAVRAALVLIPALAALPGQPSTGDIGVTGFSTSQFSVLLPGTGAAVPHAVGGFGGTGPSQAILWDPFNPQDFLVGGTGFIGRATVGASGAVSYAPLTTAVGEVAQMCFDAGGQIVVADGVSDQLVRVDPVTGVVTAITAGPQPWGTNLNAVFVDAGGGGAIYAGARGSIHVLTPVGTQLLAAFGSDFVTGIARDPFSADIVATVLSLFVNRVVRIDAAGNVTDLVPPGTILFPNCVSVDELGDFVVGASGGAVHRVPNGGGGATLIGTVAGQGSNASGVAVVGGLSGGAGPLLHVLSLASAGAGDLQVAVAGLAPSARRGWLLPSADVAPPAGSGAFFGIVPDQLTVDVVLAFPLPAAGFPLHWLDAGPGVYPHAPFHLPPGSTAPLAGVTWDFVSVAVDPTFTLVTQSNVVRHTF